MTSNPFLARFADEAALIEPSLKGRFEASLNAITGHPAAQVVTNTAYASGDDFWTELGDNWTRALRPYCVEDGVLMIPVKGVLMNEFPYQMFDWATGYEYIREAMSRGLADSNVKEIRLIVNSPGGMVAGNFDTVDMIYAARGQKPISGHANEAAYSAAYSLISAVDPGKLMVARTGGVGSIGVVTGHLDMSAALDKAGLVFTFIYAGDGKAEGNSYEALSPDAKQRIQTRIDELYSVFVSTVARNRGLSESAIRDELGAYTYTASKAVSNGLADRITSFDDPVSSVVSEDDQDEPSDDNDGEDDMTTPVATVDQAVHEQAVKDAGAAMQARIGEILGCDEAQGRDNLAKHFAFNTDMSVDAAKAALAAAPKDAPAPAPAEPAATTSFAGAMERTPNPNIAAVPGEQAPGGKAPAATELRELASMVGLAGFTK